MPGRLEITATGHLQTVGHLSTRPFQWCVQDELIRRELNDLSAQYHQSWDNMVHRFYLLTQDADAGKAVLGIARFDNDATKLSTHCFIAAQANADPWRLQGKTSTVRVCLVSNHFIRIAFRG
jgi:hypothetical protein